MAKVSFSADISAEGGMVVDPRHNIHEKDGTYLTTVRAATAEDALAQAKADYPDLDLITAPGKTPRAKFAKSHASPRHNFYVMTDEGPEYFCTERADNPDDALAAAKANNPGVDLLSIADLV